MLKLDVDLKPEERTATSDVVIKAGDLIELHKKSERLEVFTISGTLLGTVPETVAEKLSAEEWIGHIRSLKRSTIDNNIVFISVRFSSGERLRRERGMRAFSVYVLVLPFIALRSLKMND